MDLSNSARLLTRLSLWNIIIATNCLVYFDQKHGFDCEIRCRFVWYLIQIYTRRLVLQASLSVSAKRCFDCVHSDRYKSELNRSLWSVSHDKITKSTWMKLSKRDRCSVLTRAPSYIDIFYELFDNLFSCTRNTVLSSYSSSCFCTFRFYRSLRFIWHCDFDCVFFFFLFFCFIFIFIVRELCFVLNIWCVLLLLFRFFSAACYDRCGNLSQQDANLLFATKRNNAKTMCKERENLYLKTHTHTHTHSWK